jgi:hypothetical protein
MHKPALTACQIRHFRPELIRLSSRRAANKSQAAHRWA